MTRCSSQTHPAQSRKLARPNSNSGNVSSGLLLPWRASHDVVTQWVGTWVGRIPRPGLAIGEKPTFSGPQSAKGLWRLLDRLVDTRRRHGGAGRKANLVDGTPPTTRISRGYSPPGCSSRGAEGRSTATTAFMRAAILFVRWRPANSGTLEKPCQPSTEIRHDSTASAGPN